MPLIGNVRGVRPPITNILYDTMWHHLPNVLYQASQFLLSIKVGGIFPEATVFQRFSVPSVILVPFCVICHWCITSSLRFECRTGNVWSAKAKVEGGHWVLLFLWCAGGIGSPGALFMISTPRENLNCCTSWCGIVIAPG